MSKIQDKQYYMDVVDNLRASDMYTEAVEMVVLIDYIFTPPTAEEVCEALEEDYMTDIAKIGVVYDKINNAFRVGKTFNCICEYDEYEKKINYHWIVSPRSSKLIGRFYEGLEREGE